MRSLQKKIGRTLLAASLIWLIGGASMSNVAWSQKIRFEKLRHDMVDKEVVGAGVTHPGVIDSMKKCPRHEFVPREFRERSYFDMSLPIGQKQTISSPFIVAYMTESLDPQPTDKVLEIGTGSGYQAAILSPLVDHVYSIEIVEQLGRRASRTLSRLRYTNVDVKVGDGFKGWPEHAPFDKIVVTCSPEDVPTPLVDQLREGGRLVIPVGERYQQTLYLFTKRDGKLESEVLRPTLFVPMTGSAESRRDVIPDPSNPKVVNGSFDEVAKDGFISGWYYQRQVECVTDESSPTEGKVACFSNADPGRGCRLLQGIAVDGRKVRRLELSVRVRTKDVRPGPEKQLPGVLISFYDTNRRDVGQNWLGPWTGTNEWGKSAKTIDVPRTAREAIVRVGLFGATGTAYFDDVRLRNDTKNVPTN